MCDWLLARCSVEFMKQVFPKFCKPQAPGRAQTPPVLTERANKGLGSASCSACWPKKSEDRRNEKEERGREGRMEGCMFT